MKLYLQAALLFFFLFFTMMAGLSQELSIGDGCPNLPLIKYNGNAVQSFYLSDLKSKLIIIDFWGTGCTSCVQAFPKIDILQKKFSNEVQFILVNKESADSTRRFFSKRKKIKIPDVPMVMGDSNLHHLFPHFFVPHHVWLDSNKIVRHITDGHNATEKNIYDFLRGREVEVSFKKDMTVFEDPLVSKIPNWKENVIYYSALSRCISGLTISNAIESTRDDDRPNRISSNCSSISQLFQVAFEEGNKYNFDPSNTIILDVKDKWKFTFPEDKDQYGEWYKSNAYYYELVVPPASSTNLYKIMQKDLLSFFDAAVRVEKRKIKCLLLVSRGDLNRLRTRGGKSETNFWSMNEDSIKYIRNQPFERITDWLTRIPRGYGLSTPLISLVKFTGNVDFQIRSTVLHADQFDLSRLREALQKYGLDLVEKLYLTDVLVISDKKRKQE